MTKRQLAKRRKVSTRTVDKWLTQGCPHTKTKTGALLFDAARVEQWYNQAIKSPVPSDPDFLKARARKEQALAEKHELDLRMRIGELVDKQSAQKAWFNAGRQIRDAFMNLPDRLAGPLAEQSQAIVHAMLTKEIRQVLTSLATAAPLE